MRIDRELEDVLKINSWGVGTNEMNRRNAGRHGYFEGQLRKTSLS